MSDGENEDAIHVEQLEIFACIGVTDPERANRQRLTVSITLWPKPTFDNLQDDITRTVNYSAICVAARDTAEARPHCLIETLGEQIASQLLRAFPIRKIKIELRKFVLPDAAYVSVGITRTASSQ